MEKERHHRTSARTARSAKNSSRTARRLSRRSENCCISAVSLQMTNSECKNSARKVGTVTNWASSVSIGVREDPESVAGFAKQLADDLDGSGDMNVIVSVTRGEADDDVTDAVHLLRSAHAILTILSDRRRADKDEIWVGEMLDRLDSLIQSYDEEKRPFELCGHCQIKKPEKELEVDDDWVPTCPDCAEKDGEHSE